MIKTIQVCSSSYGWAYIKAETNRNTAWFGIYADLAITQFNGVDSLHEIYIGEFRTEGEAMDAAQDAFLAHHNHECDATVPA